MSDAPLTLYRLVIGRWGKPNYYHSAEVSWTEIAGLDLPERRLLEELALHSLRLPGVVAIRIDEVPQLPLPE